jgi:hypothetical protein
MMPQFKDLHSLPEDDRITQIGQHAMAGNIVGFIVEDEPGKLERYLEKLKTQFPRIRVIISFTGPIPGTITTKVGPPLT